VLAAKNNHYNEKLREMRHDYPAFDGVQRIFFVKVKVDCSGKRPWVLRKFEDFETYFCIK
jgi:hypothetical protein